jgi:hypothetical protein
MANSIVHVVEQDFVQNEWKILREWEKLRKCVCEFICMQTTVSFTDSDCCWQADYFESIMTTLEASFIFWCSWGSSKNWLELKIEPPAANLACLNWWNTSYVNYKRFFIPHPNFTFCLSEKQLFLTKYILSLWWTYLPYRLSYLIIMPGYANKG